jgi:7,8-dihydropterin-6-yl-methyl-4-(beta-D-ribofuranosyl)aminobenzene 5'-phosphate synthase
MKAWMAALMIVLATLIGSSVQAADGTAHQAKALKVTTLSTMLTDTKGLGEWGYAALVEVDGKRILFDTGANPDIVLRNADVLEIDLSTVEDVIISHFHDDHTGGLITLRKAMMAKNPSALSHLHVGSGIFDARYEAGGAGPNENGFADLAKAYLATGGRISEVSAPAELATGVWLTGPVPRGHAETNLNAGLFIKSGGSLVPDTLREDSSLVIATAAGTVIITGCGHAGIMNIADAAGVITGDSRLHAVIGGIHLFAKLDDVLVETAGRLKGLAYLLAGHCTGIEATVRLRGLLGLDQRTAVVAAVGSSFAFGKGIEAGWIAGWAG